MDVEEFLDQLVEGALTPLRYAWMGLCWVGRGIAMAYRFYMAIVGNFGPKIQGAIHSTVFMSIGETIAHFLLKVI
jgi:hypothetical protein